MADAKVDALRDEVNRRFGKLEKDLKELVGRLDDVASSVKQAAKDAHNELAQARREERDANAETIQDGVGQAAEVARSEVAERVGEVRDELRDWFDQIGDAFKAR